MRTVIIKRRARPCTPARLLASAAVLVVLAFLAWPGRGPSAKQGTQGGGPALSLANEVGDPLCCRSRAGNAQRR